LIFFNHPETTVEEKELLLQCSVLKGIIDIKEINFLYGSGDSLMVVSALIDKLLIKQKQGLYEIHPLIRSFCYEKLVDKIAVHKKVSIFFISQRTNILDVALEEKIFYHLNEAGDWNEIVRFIEAKGKKLISQGQLRLLLEMINRVQNALVHKPVFDVLTGDIYQIRGEWSEAIRFFERASSNTENESVKAEGMVKVGEIFLRRGDLREAEDYFKKTYEFAKIHSLRREEARSLNDMGLVDYAFGKLDSAYGKHKAALKIQEELNDLEGLANNYNNLANLFSENGKFTKSIEYLAKSRKIWTDANDVVNLPLYHGNVASVLMKQNKLNEALKEVNTSLEMSRNNGDKAAIANCLIIKGNILSRNQKHGESLRNYKDSLEVASEIGDKRKIATAYNNIGAYYSEKKDFDNGFFFLLKASALAKPLGFKAENDIPLNWISSIKRDDLSKMEFDRIFNIAYLKLEPNEQHQINVNDFLDSDNKVTKVGRNDPCPCGRGKKYKQCHGKDV
jgi:tetratricopeptide (TPR) repeat protein